MIFVTVGTDHHPFDRLIQAVDRFKSQGRLPDEIFIQRGASRIRPQACAFRDFFPFEDLMARMDKARIVVAHAGPGSIMPVLYRGNIPVVLAREKRFGEAVDDHQKDFAARLETEGLILYAADAADLEDKLINYDALVRGRRSDSTAADREERLSRFIQKLEALCLDLVSGKIR